MNTALECMPCFMKMVLREAQLACPRDPEMHRRIVAAWGRKLGELDLTQPPPEVARHLAEMIRSETGCGDLYVEDKKQANDTVMGMLDRLVPLLDARRSFFGSALDYALELAVIGNYIDRGVELDFDFEAEIAAVTESIDRKVFGRFEQALSSGSDVLVLGDNTGEIVLDTLLVAEMQRLGCRVTYAVRSKHAINDATMADAEYVGMTRLCEVVESGVDTPGTVLSRCTPAFLERMRKADVILSKGQGNFESLQGVWPGIFCAFKVKCDRVSRELGMPMGRSVLIETWKDGES